jgi:hypothetical protein
VVQQESAGKVNIIFFMHPSELHYFNLDDKNFMFVSTVAKKKKEFMKQQVQCAEVARMLYHKL